MRLKEHLHFPLAKTTRIATFIPKNHISVFSRVPDGFIRKSCQNFTVYPFKGNSAFHKNIIEFQ